MSQNITLTEGTKLFVNWTFEYVNADGNKMYPMPAWLEANLPFYIILFIIAASVVTVLIGTRIESYFKPKEETKE